MKKHKENLLKLSSIKKELATKKQKNRELKHKEPKLEEEGRRKKQKTQSQQTGSSDKGKNKEQENKQEKEGNAQIKAKADLPQAKEMEALKRNRNKKEERLLKVRREKKETISKINKLEDEYSKEGKKLVALEKQNRNAQKPEKSEGSNTIAMIGGRLRELGATLTLKLSKFLSAHEAPVAKKKKVMQPEKEIQKAAKDGIEHARGQKIFPGKERQPAKGGPMKDIKQEIAQTKKRLADLETEITSEKKKLSEIEKKEKNIINNIKEIDKKLLAPKGPENPVRQKQKLSDEIKKKEGMPIPTINVDNRGVDPIGNFKENYSKNYKQLASERIRENVLQGLKNREESKQEKTIQKDIQKKVRL